MLTMAGLFQTDFCICRPLLTSVVIGICTSPARDGNLAPGYRLGRHMGAGTVLLASGTRRPCLPGMGRCVLACRGLWPCPVGCGCAAGVAASAGWGVDCSRGLLEGVARKCVGCTLTLWSPPSPLGFRAQHPQRLSGGQCPGGAKCVSGLETGLAAQGLQARKRARMDEEASDPTSAAAQPHWLRGHVTPATCLSPR